MFKIILIPVFLLFSQWGHAQLEMHEPAPWTTIGELKFGGITRAKLEYSANGKDTSYLLLMKDSEENRKNHYFSVKFKNYRGTYSQFYEIMKSFFLPENRKNKKYMKTFTLGDTGVNLQHIFKLNGASVLLTTRDGFTFFSEKDIDKLFGQKD